MSAPVSAPASSAERRDQHAGARAALALGALGVVFGDLGTSPLYTVQTVFNPSDPHPVPVVKNNIYGVISLIFWSVTIIVTITYVLLVMRADNNGEGGIMALITLIRRGRPARRRRTTLILAALGLFGASLFFGDSMITPAISVLSAIEGVKVAAPSLADFVRTNYRGHPARPVLDPTVGDGKGGQALRTGDGHLVRDDRCLRGTRNRRSSGHRQGAPAQLCVGLPRESLLDRVLFIGGRGARRDRRRGALCGHGPLRPSADQPSVAADRLSGLHAQLHGPGCPRPRRSTPRR